jgi:hypothetical protein
MGSHVHYDDLDNLFCQDSELIIVDAGYRAILTCVDSTQLDAEFAGRASG